MDKTGAYRFFAMANEPDNIQFLLSQGNDVTMFGTCCIGEGSSKCRKEVDREERPVEVELKASSSSFPRPSRYSLPVAMEMGKMDQNACSPSADDNFSSGQSLESRSVTDYMARWKSSRLTAMQVLVLATSLYRTHPLQTSAIP